MTPKLSPKQVSLKCGPWFTRRSINKDPVLDADLGILALEKISLKIYLEKNISLEIFIPRKII